MKNFQIFLCTITFALSAVYAAGQCSIAQSQEEVAEEHTFTLIYDAEQILPLTKSVCLADVISQKDSICHGLEEDVVSLWFRVQKDENDNVNNYGVYHSIVTTNFEVDPVWCYYYEFESTVFFPYSPCNYEIKNTDNHFAYFGGSTSLLIKVTLPYNEGYSEDDVVTVSAYLNPFKTEEDCNEVRLDETVDHLEVSITERENTDLNDREIAAFEEVTVSISFSYSLPQTSFAHSFVPVLGDGWDYKYFLDNVQLATADSKTGEWLIEDDDCNGEFRRNLPSHCIYSDAEGRPKLCNMLLENCPCSSSVKVEDTMPPAWYFTDNATLSTCGNGCNPSNKKGSISRVGEFSAILKLRASPDATKQDLSISIQPFADYTTGCRVEFDDKKCSLVLPATNDNFRKVSNSKSIVSFEMPENLCNDEFFDITVFRNLLSSEEISLQISPNANIAGINDLDDLTSTSNFSNLSLRNISSEIQYAAFTLKGIDQDGNILTSDEELVAILPQLALVNTEVKTCNEGCVQFTVDNNWESIRKVSYDWSDGIVGPTREICAGQIYEVTLTDERLCESSKEDIEIVIIDSFQHELIGPDILCSVGLEESFEVLIDDESNISNIKWLFENAIGNIRSVVAATSVEVPTFIKNQGLPFEITLLLLDDFGCTVPLTMEVSIFNNADQFFVDAICRDATNTTVRQRAPTGMQQDSVIEIFSVTNDLNIEVEWGDGDSLTLVFDMPSEASADFRVRKIFANGCSQIVHYDFDFLSVEDVSMEYFINDFEIDFLLGGAALVDSVLWNFGDGNTSTDLFPSHIYDSLGVYVVTAEIYTNCGDKVLEETIYTDFTSRKEVSEKVLKVLPNPAKNEISIEGTAEGILYGLVFNAAGQKVLRLNRTQLDQTVDISCLPNGYYIISFVGEDFSFNSSLVVAR